MGFFVLFHRMLVTEKLGSNAVGENRKMYLMGSVHIAVICVTKHSGTQVTLKCINVYILGSVHIAVMCVIKHSKTQVP
jgi:hypothetical protein